MVWLLATGIGGRLHDLGRPIWVWPAVTAALFAASYAMSLAYAAAFGIDAMGPVATLTAIFAIFAVPVYATFSAGETGPNRFGEGGSATDDQAVGTV